MFTLVAWSASVNPTTLTAIAAVTDQSVRTNVNDIIVPAGMSNAVAAYIHGTIITRAQLQSPSTRRFINHEIHPVEAVASPASPPRFFDLRGSPIDLDEQEALNMAVVTTGGAATRADGLCWLSDGAVAPVGGQIRTVRVTSTATTVAGAWTTATLTFDQTLPAGEYKVVGAMFVATNLVAARLVFPGYPWRPGSLGQATDGGLGYGPFRYGGFGDWGPFYHNTPPTVEYLSNAADTNPTGVLDIVKLS